MNYIDNKTHFRNVLRNLRWMIPIIVGATLIFMGLRMAFATWVGIN